VHLIFCWEEEHIVSPRPIHGQGILVKEFAEKEFELGGLASVDFDADGLVDSHHPALGLLVIDRDLFALFGAAACFERGGCRADSSALIRDNLGATGWVNESS